jgi:hypothetical protein
VHCDQLNGKESRKKKKPFGSDIEEREDKVGNANETTFTNPSEVCEASQIDVD